MAGAGSQSRQPECMVSAAQSTRQLSHRGTQETHLKSLTDSGSSNNKLYECHYNARIPMPPREVPLHYTSVSLWGVNRAAEHLHTWVSIYRGGGSVMKGNICKAAYHADIPPVWIGNIVDLLNHSQDQGTLGGGGVQCALVLGQTASALSVTDELNCKNLKSVSQCCRRHKFAILISILESTNVHLCRDTQQPTIREKLIMKCMSQMLFFPANMAKNLHISQKETK